MKWLLYIIGVLWISAGSSFILYTNQCRHVLKKTVQGTDPRLISIVPIAIGALLIVGAYQTALPWVVVLLGILAIGKGCMVLFNPGRLASRLICWFFEQASENTWRLAGIIALILGTALLSWL
jgi:hypothetical protein